MTDFSLVFSILKITGLNPSLQEQIVSWFDICPISENDRVKMGYQNAAKLLKI